MHWSKPQQHESGAVWDSVLPMVFLPSVHLLLQHHSIFFQVVLYAKEELLNSQKNARLFSFVCHYNSSLHNTQQWLGTRCTINSICYANHNGFIAMLLPSVVFICSLSYTEICTLFKVRTTFFFLHGHNP